jgi:hypothetical protein
LAIASSPPLRRLTSRRKVGLLPGEALQRLKDDLANWTDLEPVVVYAADLRTLIELAEPGRPQNYMRPARGGFSSRTEDGERPVQRLNARVNAIGRS